MKVVGLDLSLRATGFCNTRLVTQVWKPPAKLRGVARLQWFHQRTGEMIASFRPDVAFVEGYSFGSKGRATFSVAELGGVVRLALFQWGVPHVDVPPSTLKMFATGRGNANKDEVLSAAVLRAQRSFSNDEADAMWLAALGLSIYGQPPFELPKTHLRALDKLEVPVLSAPADV